MKTIDIKSFLIGILTCTCLFLFMGQTPIKINGKEPIEVKLVGMEQLTFPSYIDVSVKEFPRLGKLSGWDGIKVDLSRTTLDVEVKK